MFKLNYGNFQTAQNTPSHKKNMLLVRIISMDRGSTIATRYRLDGPGIKSWWKQVFPYSSRLVQRPTQPPIQWVPGHSLRWSGQGMVLTTYPI